MCETFAYGSSILSTFNRAAVICHGDAFQTLERADAAFTKTGSKGQESSRLQSWR